MMSELSPSVGHQMILQEGESVPSQVVAQEARPINLAALPVWQRRYLLAVQAGATEAEAQVAGNCSAETIQRICIESLPFARARDAIIHNTPADRIAMRSMAESLGASVVLDAFAESRGLDPKTGEVAYETITLKNGRQIEREAIAPRDRVTNRRLVLEAAGAIGAASQTQGAQQAPIIVQVHITQAPTPAPVVVVSPDP